MGSTNLKFMESSLKPDTTSANKQRKAFGGVDEELEAELNKPSKQVVEVMNFDTEGTPTKQVYEQQDAYMMTLN
jgi:hypothetical protein